MSKTNHLQKICFLAMLFILSACSGSVNPESQPEIFDPETDEIRLDGELIEIEQDSLVIRQVDGTDTILNLSAQSIFWEGNEWMGKTPAVVGDQITAYGNWTKDKTVFEVDQYYANRVDLKGIVFYVCGETEAFMLNQPDQEYVILPLPQKTELLTETPEDPTSYKYFDLMPNFGEKLEVVGRSIEEPYLIAVRFTRMN